MTKTKLPAQWPVASQRKSTDLTDAKLATRRVTDNYFRSKGQIIGGTADALYAAGGKDLFKWLSKQTPEGATICETLAAIALDTMNEEQDQ
jgi:hypothetical protein